MCPQKLQRMPDIKAPLVVDHHHWTFLTDKSLLFVFSWLAHIDV